MTKASEEVRMVQYLCRRLLPLAAGIGLLIAILGPITYWIIEHRNLQRITTLYAEELAEKFQRFALESPGLWKYQTYKFIDITEGFHPFIDLLGFSVLDENGEPIGGYDYKRGWQKHGRRLTFTEELNFTLGTAPILFNNQRVGTIEILVSDARLQRASALLFCFSAAVGAGLAFMMYRFPVRVVRRMEEKIKKLMDALHRLNAELELKVEERTGQLIEAQEELVRKEKLAILGQLSASVGHELRNPLGVMNNSVYLLKCLLANADESVREYLGIIENEINSSQRIITDLLDFTRTRSPQLQAVTVRQLVEESFAHCAIPDSVTLRAELPETLPALRVDPQQMGQVLQNLISNGVQAMPEGGALSIIAETGEEERELWISVTDRGTGIEPENLKKLFQPLFTTKARGIGLGLTICRNLTEANGGRIEVESRVGEGTTFTLKLPVAGEGDGTPCPIPEGEK